MLFNIVKFLHILFVMIAFGANITCGVWQARARWSWSPVRRWPGGTGRTRRTGSWAAIVLFVAMFVFALAVYSPALTHQI